MSKGSPDEIFRDQVWPQRAAVLRAAAVLVADRSVAEDLTQETLLKAYRAMDRFTPGTDARAWLLAILRNARIDWLRSPAGRAHMTAGPMPEDVADDVETVNPSADPSDVDALLERLTDAELIRAMQELPEDIRWTLLLVDVEQMDLSEAANVMDVPVGTVKSRAHRGRAMLRQRLQPIAESMGYLRRRSAPKTP